MYKHEAYWPLLQVSTQIDYINVYSFITQMTLFCEKKIIPMQSKHQKPLIEIRSLDKKIPPEYAHAFMERDIFCLLSSIIPMPIFNIVDYLHLIYVL